MKNRTGFVSNSSSSSFVLATNPSNVGEPIKLTIECPFDNIIDKIISTQKELQEYIIEKSDLRIEDYDSFVEFLSQDDNRWYVEDYYRMLKIIDSGKVLLLGWCSNEDDNEVGVILYQNGAENIIDSNKYEVVTDVMN